LWESAKDGVRFCENCGTAVEMNTAQQMDYQYNMERQKIGDELNRNSKKKNVKREETAFEKVSKFFGLFLMILAFIDFKSDPPILTILLSLAIIAGAIFCLIQKYRLKGFTIIAIIIAAYCLFAGFSQGKEIGFFKVPTEADYAEAYGKENAENKMPSVEVETKEETEEPVVQEVPAVTESEANTYVKEKAESVDGVDPELKAFLDSYEDFMDEYVEFMKKYMDDPGNAVSMLSDYAVIMEKYSDFAEKIEAYDEEEMSTEDAKYYLEVVNRCNQKMLELY